MNKQPINGSHAALSKPDEVQRQIGLFPVAVEVPSVIIDAPPKRKYFLSPGFVFIASNGMMFTVIQRPDGQLSVHETTTGTAVLTAPDVVTAILSTDEMLALNPTIKAQLASYKKVNELEKCEGDEGLKALMLI